jgi:hypothetical protein
MDYARCNQSPPAIKRAIVQLICDGCGAETHASCNCGAIYRPKALERAAAAVAEHPEKSDRAIAKEIGVSHPTVAKARKETTGNSYQLDEPRIGLDNKTRQMPKPATKSPAVAEREIVTKLALDMVDACYMAMSNRFADDKPTMARLREARDDLRQHLSSIQWF